MSIVASCAPAVVLPIAVALLALKARIPARPDTKYRCTVLWFSEATTDDQSCLEAAAEDTRVPEEHVH